MTAIEWLSSSDPQALLSAYISSGRPAAIAEQLANFCLGCSRLAGLKVQDQISASLNPKWRPTTTPINAATMWCQPNAMLEPMQCADLLRCTTGWLVNQTIEPVVFRWNGGCVNDIAQSIITTGDFSVLPILADALEEAGCTNRDLLNHCRNIRGVRRVHCTHWCYRCNKRGVRRRGVHFDHMLRCPDCDISWDPGEDLYVEDRTVQADMVHAHGCWALYLILLGFQHERPPSN